MTPIPAKVLNVAKQSSQYRVLVQIELEKYLGSFRTLRFGEANRFTAHVIAVSWIFFTTEIPALKQGSHSHYGRFSERANTLFIRHEVFEYAHF